MEAQVSREFPAHRWSEKFYLYALECVKGPVQLIPRHPSSKVAQFRDYRGLPLAMISPAGGRAGVSEHLAPSGILDAPSGTPVLPAPSRELNCELQDEIQ